MKTKSRIREVLVEEWYSKRNGKVYLNWKFRDGRVMRKLTPYSDIPWVEINFLEI